MLNRRFFIVDTLRCQRNGMRRPRITKSVIMLITPAAIIAASKLMHLPDTVEIHIFLNGTHWKMLPKSYAIPYALTKRPRPIKIYLNER